MPEDLVLGRCEVPQELLHLGHVDMDRARGDVNNSYACNHNSKTLIVIVSFINVMIAIIVIIITIITIIMIRGLPRQAG